MRSFVLALCLLASPAAPATQFHFVALGDTAYNQETDLPVYERLIHLINDTRPAFTLHVGDVWGALECSRENYEWIRGWFQRYRHPVVYTPGDNEWTDCRKPEILNAYNAFLRHEATREQMALLGRAQQPEQAFEGTSYADPVARLAMIREVFFAKPRSLGARTMAVERQADVSKYDAMVENLRFEHGGVLFATVDVPGSGYGFTINDGRRAANAVELNRANFDWLKQTFALAAESDAKAVVIAMHASLFEAGDGEDGFGQRLRGGQDGPYHWVALAIRDFGERFGKPVLVIHGDFHRFIVDRPFLVSHGEVEQPRYGNIMRLQVFGAPELKAVRVDVDTDTPWVFSFSPLYE